MTRAAAERGFDSFLADTVAATREEFSVERVLRGTGLGPGGRVVDRLRDRAETLERRVLEPELADYRERARRQFGVVLDYAESNDSIEEFHEDLLAHDSYVSALEPGTSAATRAALVEDVLDRARRLGDGIAPVVASPEDEFWPAVETALDRDAALRLVEEGFPFTGPLRRHRGSIEMAVRIDPGNLLGGPASVLPSVGLDYTDEALRAMTRAERRVLRDLRREIDNRLGE